MSTNSEAAAPARSAKEQFDKQAAHYNAQWNTWSAETLDWLLANSGHRPTDRVLDVATGTGFTALAFAPHVAEVVGGDVSTGMLEQARKQAEERGVTNATFQEAPAEALPYPDAAFDIVVSRIAPHHFLNIQKFASEAARVLKSGGRLALVDTSVPDDDWEAADWQNAVEVLRDPSHVRNYTPREWRKIWEDAGLTVETIGDAGGGITIPLSDWIFKAGCTPDQAQQVRDQFANAPESAKAIYNIVTQPDGETVFTWRRVAVRAVKP
ncbi:putative methyltransferase YcgJ [Capsulimonas corticalis]|uniref:Methyltransferase YcgJ n=1 Tax=Capsulimonas corticalis TaxID=2219043 RepID=A0A402CP66_9BACT|nr:methyltransferase domain-containing protein [Capsulimonas corticalis]BDI33104.1 putative methyltransferase YcgJ [Capsulimonas corticalis]